MNLPQKMLTKLRFKVCELLDETVIPFYSEQREALFESVGEEAPLMPIIALELGEEPEEVEVDLGQLQTDPQIAALAALNESLSSAVWVNTNNGMSKLNAPQYYIASVMVQTGEEGNNQFMVLLQDKHTGATQPLPLHKLLENFRPLRDLTAQDLHS